MKNKLTTMKKTTMYKGKEVQYEDCAPKWVGVYQIYLAVLQNPKATASAKNSAETELKNMAIAADKYNTLVDKIMTSKVGDKLDKLIK
jgi:hypothetical protein